MERIVTKELRFLDESGRTRIFNGMNIDDKLRDQQAFRYLLDEEFFKKFRAFGLDFIRLAVTWQNIEPQPGKYNENYLLSLDRIFNLAEKHGVYILLDMHQDLYSGNDGESVGDGAPAWAVLTDGAKPRMPIFVWADGYFFGKWVRRSFDNFWNNTPVHGKGLQEHYCALWQMLARRYGDRPALFGFDLMNEPFPGTLSKRMFRKLLTSAAKEVLTNKKISRSTMLKALVKGDIPTALDGIGGDIIPDIMRRVDDAQAIFDKTAYAPFLNKTTAAIREVTKNGIIMMEQSYICNSGVKQSAPPITVNGIREPLQCFGPHGYDVAVDTPLYQYANADRVKAFFTEMYHTQLRLQVPVIVGEWGGCSDNKDTSWFPHAYELLDFFDEKQWGQAYWDYHGDDMDSPLMELLSRAHPVAVAGDIIRYRFDRKSNRFTLHYRADGNETQLYLPGPFTAEGDIPVRIIEQYENGAALIGVTLPAGEHTVSFTLTA